MADECTRDNCRNCIIRDLKQLKPHDLLDFCTCNSRDLFPFIKCANGKCGNADCNTDRLMPLLECGHGCQFYRHRSRAEIPYKFIESVPINGKPYKVVAQDSLKLQDFVKKCLVSLKDYLWHKFVHKKQNYEKKVLFTKLHNRYLLHPGWLFVTIDFISNYQLASDKTTQGMTQI